MIIKSVADKSLNCFSWLREKCSFSLMCIICQAYLNWNWAREHFWLSQYALQGAAETNTQHYFWFSVVVQLLELRCFCCCYDNGYNREAEQKQCGGWRQGSWWVWKWTGDLELFIGHFSQRRWQRRFRGNKPACVSAKEREKAGSCCHEF